MLTRDGNRHDNESGYLLDQADLVSIRTFKRNVLRDTYFWKMFSNAVLSQS